MDTLAAEMWNHLLLFLCCSGFICSGLEVKTVVMDSPEVCYQNAGKTFWASNQRAILVTGRGSDYRQSSRSCSIVVGAATSSSSILQLSFEAFHIADCGVVLAVTQSSHSNFLPDSSVMAKIGCNHGNIKVLRSQEKHFVKISVLKDVSNLQRYNFRINITVTDKGQNSSYTDQPRSSTDKGSRLSESLKSEMSDTLEPNSLTAPVNETHDKLPETGPETHVVVIVGFVTSFVVGVALWLLFQYLIRVTRRWREHCAERNMERAIRLYNNQVTPPESDYMYTALPPREATSANVPAHGNGHCHQSKNSGTRGRQRGGDITFVHVDGHIETFRMRDNPQERHSNGSAPATAASTPRSTRHAPSRGNGDAESVTEDNPNREDNYAECPPSYDEALQMPTLQDEGPRPYVNVDSKQDDNHTT